MSAIILDVEQGTPEWEQARIGMPTASQFDKILTPARLKLSSQAPKYRNQILAEWLVGYPIDWGGSSDFMDRGTALEPRARAYYEFERDVEVEQVGMVLRADRRVGGSPDGLVGTDGGLEIKCPALHTHVGYLLDPASLIDAYHGQVQGLLYLTGRKWWDLLAYSPALPSVIERVEPDVEYHNALDEALGQFLDDLDECKRKLAGHREQPERSPLPGEGSDLLRRLERSVEVAA